MQKYLEKFPLFLPEYFNPLHFCILKNPNAYFHLKNEPLLLLLYVNYAL